MKKGICTADAFFHGAGGRTRTGDLLITNQLLYQLSHTSERNLLNGSIITQHTAKCKSFFRKI